MAGSAWQSVPKFVGFSVAGIGILFFIGILAVVMLILSLIPIYSSNNSNSGYGEIYTIQGLTIKAIYTNVSFNFTGGSVLSVSGLSNLCTTILRSQQIPGFSACVATNFSAYGPTGNLNPSTVVRRNLNDVALYEVGNIELLFSNTCSNRRALGYWSLFLSHTQNSSCVAQRLAACRRFISTPNSGSSSNQWSPLPTAYTQLVVANGTFCAAISITNIYNVAYYNYASVYSYYNVTTPYTNAGDCYLTSIVPQWYLQNYINSQTPNASLCSSASG